MKLPKTIADVCVNKFLILLLFYFVLQVILRIIISPNVGLDESEMLILTQKLSLGYNSQPPLYAWIQYLYFKLFGVNIFAMSLLKNTLLFLTYYFVYQSSYIITKDRIAASLASSGLIFFPQISWESQRALTHSVLVTTISSATLYVLLKIKNASQKEIKISHYIILGVLIGLGMLSKYNYAIFILALFIALLLERSNSYLLLKKESFIVVIVATILVLPHFYWILTHLSLATSSIIHKLHPTHNSLHFLYGIADLLRAIIVFIAVFVIIFTLFFGKYFTNNKNKFLFYFLVSVLAILAIFAIVSGATKFKDRWMQPYLFVFSLYLTSNLNIKKIKKEKIGYYFMSVCLFMCIIFAALVFRTCFSDLIGKHKKLNYPFHAISYKIKNRLGFDNGIIVAENYFIGGNLKLNFKNSKVYIGHCPNTAKKDKVLIAWKKNRPCNTNIKKQTYLQECISSRYFCSKKGYYKLNVILINPKKP